ncbi:DUF721 domain-containing protein [Candidatus Megaera venefica]|jgi:hypothetical protein|uniref:DUF721 domain-containing protein n=1 Tax=Candidatus Megaera venefica TaxID=2055910 RepID=A0ABU5NC11_9RICK|nr:DciA family protein [Candidatus Megaera venefica]MEA0970677.1 DUF721 domain-containing protein [Candidatus Megaera venefica]
MRPIVNDVNKLIYSIYKRQNPILAELIVNWGKIVGVKYSTQSNPLKITTIREGGKQINILQVVVDSSSISMEIAYQQELMIERIAIYLGYKGIHKIKLLVRG